MITTGLLHCISTARRFPSHLKTRFLLAQIIINGHRCLSFSMIREFTYIVTTLARQGLEANRAKT